MNVTAPLIPLYQHWRERVGCNGTCDASPNSSQHLLNNASLLSYLYGTSSKRRKLAIATVHTVGSARSAGCGLLKWCFSAAAFAKSPVLDGAAEAVVLTNNLTWARGECRTPSVRFIAADPTLELLVRQWGQLHKPGASKKRSRPPRPVTLMKWQLFALTDYDAIFYHDVDVDPFLHTNGRPPSEGTPLFDPFASSWLRGYEAFLRSGTELLALRDPHIPINTGTMLLRPSERVHAIGMRTLQAMRFNFTHGFNLSGRPRDVLPFKQMARADVKRLRDSRMSRMNTWDVVCGDADQGLFVHVFLVVLRGKTFAYPVRDNGFRVHHFFALHKPWGKKTRCLKYYAFLRDPDFLSAGRHGEDRMSHCLRKLEEKRGCLEADRLPHGAERDDLCKTCAKNGQKHTCPRRAQVNGTWMDTPGNPTFCPTAATRWWVF